jgi:dephospho-CoA kinase
MRREQREKGRETRHWSRPSSLVPKRLILGVTGGIATGKSSVLRLLSKAGIPTISADDLAHACIRKGKPAYRAIVRHFGREVLTADRQIDRRKLGHIVFNAPSERKRLEKIIHPCVLKALKQFVRNKKGMVALDIPLLFEAGYQRFVDKVIVVYASKNQQITRLRRRNRLSRHEALQRINAQIPLSVKCRRADIVLRNTGTLSDLRRHLTYALLTLL